MYGHISNLTYSEFSLHRYNHADIYIMLLIYLVAGLDMSKTSAPATSPGFGMIAFLNIAQTIIFQYFYDHMITFSNLLPLHLPLHLPLL